MLTGSLACIGCGKGAEKFFHRNNRTQLRRVWILEAGHLGSSLASETHHLEKLLSLAKSQSLVSEIAMMIGPSSWSILEMDQVCTVYIQCLECCLSTSYTLD